MRKYRVSAMLYKYDNSIEDPRNRILCAKSWFHSETIVAEDEYDAMEKYPIVLALHEADLEASKILEDVGGNREL